ncbi:hypothetical protein COU54_05745 [Candidatus Pacearchaeota archaeon CG10_big_fil_rev_8_21_14_0_10_31_24]|nr:MAG: hypothetical protein COU54_05745 [Candidatus Pacearchaeota archaeon CG10_big_fil_rev_8_21_14_0_10_31_24]
MEIRIDIQERITILNNNSNLRGLDEGEAHDMNWVKEIISNTKNRITLIPKAKNKIIGLLIAQILADNNIYGDKKHRKQNIKMKLLDSLEKTNYKKDHKLYYYYKENK